MIDPREREFFAQMVQDHGGNTLAVIAQKLRGFARSIPGSPYADQCLIMAEELERTPDSAAVAFRTFNAKCRHRNPIVEGYWCIKCVEEADASKASEDPRLKAFNAKPFDLRQSGDVDPASAHGCPLYQCSPCLCSTLSSPLCSCLTKSPDIRVHSETCAYRLAEEAALNTAVVCPHDIRLPHEFQACTEALSKSAG